MDSQRGEWRADIVSLTEERARRKSKNISGWWPNRLSKVGICKSGQRFCDLVELDAIATIGKKGGESRHCLNSSRKKGLFFWRDWDRCPRSWHFRAVPFQWLNVLNLHFLKSTNCLNRGISLLLLLNCCFCCFAVLHIYSQPEEEKEELKK